ncbi:recombinase family protein [Nocardia sp. NPDC058658]|uniref:recombinase family protein n=1 Tax=Nocardia sp. NPDC058658 TaxID=3346580 RepID=UPI003662AF9C
MATELNRLAIPCPSAHRPEQNKHRSGDGWQGSTVAAILQNPRYTGYAIFGRWSKREVLLDPDDVAAGHVVRFKRSPSERIVRSRRPAHPAIVSVETFTEATLLRHKRAGASNRARSKLERTRAPGTSDCYLCRGRVRCDSCNRKMQAEVVRGAVYYRCRASTLAPGSPALELHPRTVNLREDHLVEPIDNWLATLFDRAHIDSTIAALIEAGNDDSTDARRRARYVNASRKLRCRSADTSPRSKRASSRWSSSTRSTPRRQRRLLQSRGSESSEGRTPDRNGASQADRVSGRRSRHSDRRCARAQAGAL